MIERRKVVLRSQRKEGFTIVELLIVIVVIAILASISVVAYNGIQTRAANVKTQSTIAAIQRKIEAYKAENGSYPATQSIAMSTGPTDAIVRVDSGCNSAAGPNTDKRTDWVPSIDMTLPQSSNEIGSRGDRGCFMYQSDGSYYILSAWNMVAGGPQTSTMYRRLGFREISNQHHYLCNHQNIGGANPAPYNVSRDMYKHSYTVSNITSCNENPPSGA
jgi:prepilin-type N-terminal cleavage/methylation domain-containing protein